MEVFWVIITTTVIYLLVSWILLTIHNKKLIKKYVHRKPFSEDEFVWYFVKQGHDESTIRKLYEEIKPYVPRKKFQLDPLDCLVSDYRIDEEELGEIAIKLFEKRNKRSPTEVDFERFRQTGQSINTFEGILIFTRYK